jgi:hypothetical protein
VTDYVGNATDSAAATNETCQSPTLRIDDHIIVPVIWSLLFIVGTFGNALVIYVMVRYGDRKTTNCYIVNLAIADLAFVLLVIPFTAMHYVLHSWTIGSFVCKLQVYVIYVSGLNNYYSLRAIYLLSASVSAMSNLCNI